MYTRKKLSQLPFSVPLLMTFKQRGHSKIEVVAEVFHIIRRGGRGETLGVRMIAVSRIPVGKGAWIFPMGLPVDGITEVTITYLQSATPLDPRDLPLLIGWEKRWPKRFEPLLSGENQAKLTTARAAT
jgi:hypothetical protein